MPTLVAVGHADETTAGQSAEEVERPADDLIIEPDAIAVVTRDTAGRYYMTTMWSAPQLTHP